MKHFLIALFLVGLSVTACSAAQPHTETELRTWAIDWYKKADGQDPNAFQLKIVDAFTKNALLTEKQNNIRMSDEQLQTLLTDIGAGMALNPNNH